MADAAWTKTSMKPNRRIFTATINSTNADTAILDIDDGLAYEAKKTKVQINIGATESAIQIKGALTGANPAASDLNVLEGCDAIAADADKVIEGGLDGLKVTGAISGNDTVITVSQEL